jgi:paraquat-inducible protein A
MSESVVCPTCLLRQRPLPHGEKCRCARCGGRLRSAIDLHLARRKVRAFSIAALLLYPMAIGLPVMRVEKFGHSHETGILRGTFDLLAADEVALAILLFACSIVLPLVKLVGLLLLSSGAMGDRRRGRLAGWLVRLIEGTGRWGMLDVLLVAVLAALVKLGDLVQITAGVGATTFILCVGLSLLASASFDARLVFDPAPTDHDVDPDIAVPS